MNPTFDVLFVIDRTGKLELVLTDTTNVPDTTGRFKIVYPDGVVVENAQDFAFPQVEKRYDLRVRNGNLINGTYTITQYLSDGVDEFESEKVFNFSFSDPSLLLVDNSSIALPSVSFKDSTNYEVTNYNSAITRVIKSEFPEQVDISGFVTTVSSELFMSDSGNYYEGIYNPNLTSDVTYSGNQHNVRWINTKDFSFDIRAFLGFNKIVELLNLVKSRLDERANENIRRDYFMVTSLYSHIIAKLGIGEMDVVGLALEMQDIAYRVSCACDPDYEYSALPLPAYDPENFLGGFPFIDQAIYREWNEEIIFSETSTVFFRVEGRIKWYKSKQNNNENNPIFIDGLLNDTWWEPVNDCCEYKTFREVFIASEGQTEFTLPYTPDAVLLVSINGQGPLSNINESDYDVIGPLVKLKAPNLPSESDEIVVIATYDNDQIIVNPTATRSSTTQFFEFTGSYDFELTYFPIYVRSIRNKGYVLDDDLIQYFVNDKTVSVIPSPPDFEFDLGDRIFIEYDYKPA